MNVFLTHLRAIGFAPSLVFDIGAYDGAFIDACRGVFPMARCWAFEPNLAKRDLLSAKADRVFTEVLAEGPREVVYWESELSDASGNSTMREQTNVPFRGTTRSAVDIDSLVGGQVPDLVKIDTQGSELAILKGGRRSLCQAEAVMAEVHIRRYNEGAPLFRELSAFMEEQGFAMIDIADALRVHGVLIQCDALFLKRSSAAFSENARVEFSF